MITKPVFEYAQQILAGRAQPRTRRRRFLYRGVLRCGGCGCILTAEDHLKHYPKTGRRVRYVYYRCTRAKNPHCREGYIREESLEAQFAEQLRALQLDAGPLEGLGQALHELHGKEQEYRQVRLAALRTRYDGVQKKRDVLMDRYLEGVILAENYQRKTTALREEQALVEAELRALEAAQDQLFETMEIIFKLAGSLGEIYRYGDPERKLNLTKAVASNATLQGRKARLNLFSPFEVLAKNRGHTNWLGELAFDAIRRYSVSVPVTA